MTHQVVPKLSIQGRYGCYIGPEYRDWEQPDVSPCTKSVPVSVKVVSALGSRSGPSSKYAIKRHIITMIAFLAIQVNQIVFSTIFRTMGERCAQYDWQLVADSAASGSTSLNQVTFFSS